MVISFDISIENKNRKSYSELVGYCRQEFNVKHVERQGPVDKENELNQLPWSSFSVWNASIGGRLSHYRGSQNVQLHLTFSQLLSDEPPRMVLNDRVQGLFHLIIGLMKFLGSDLACGGFDNLVQGKVSPKTYNLQFVAAKNNKKAISFIKEHIAFWYHKEMLAGEVGKIILSAAKSKETIDGYACLSFIPLDTKKSGIENALRHTLTTKYRLHLVYG